MEATFQVAAAQLIDAGRELHALGMVPATSGNFSARMHDGNIAITVSGAHKGKLTEKDIMLVSCDGTALDKRKSSAETGLHIQLYRRYPAVNAILHPHSQASTLTSRYSGDEIVLQGYELLKAFTGITSHENRLVVPVFENDQNISRLAESIDDYMQNNKNIMAYIIRGHGFYTWAATVKESLRHCEALEFLLQCEFKSTGLIRQ